MNKLIIFFNTKASSIKKIKIIKIFLINIMSSLGSGVLNQPSTCPLQPFSYLDDGNKLVITLVDKYNNVSTPFTWYGSDRFNKFDIVWKQYVNSCLNPLLYDPNYVQLQTRIGSESSTFLNAYLRSQGLSAYSPDSGKSTNGNGSSSSSGVSYSGPSTIDMVFGNWGGLIAKIVVLFIVMCIVVYPITNKTLSRKGKIFVVIFTVIMYFGLELLYNYGTSTLKPVFCKYSCNC